MPLQSVVLGLPPGSRHSITAEINESGCDGLLAWTFRLWNRLLGRLFCKGPEAVLPWMIGVLAGPAAESLGRPHGFEWSTGGSNDLGTARAFAALSLYHGTIAEDQELTSSSTGTIPCMKTAGRSAFCMSASFRALSRNRNAGSPSAAGSTRAHGRGCCRDRSGMRDGRANVRRDLLARLAILAAEPQFSCPIAVISVTAAHDNLRSASSSIRTHSYLPTPKNCVTARRQTHWEWSYVEAMTFFVGATVDLCVDSRRFIPGATFSAKPRLGSRRARFPGDSSESNE